MTAPTIEAFPLREAAVKALIDAVLTGHVDTQDSHEPTAFTGLLNQDLVETDDPITRDRYGRILNTRITATPAEGAARRLWDELDDIAATDGAQWRRLTGYRLRLLAAQATT